MALFILEGLYGVTFKKFIWQVIIEIIIIIIIIIIFIASSVLCYISVH